MNIHEAILTRRSIRKYKNKDVPEEIIIKILEAAMYAPSARNYQPWHFIVFRKRESLDSLSAIHPYGKMLSRASGAILVCGDTTIEPSIEYINQDCSAATQNILLSAHGFGLGAVWLGVYPREERIEKLREFAALPEEIVPVSLISLGYPDENKEDPGRFIRERICNEKWNRPYFT